MKLAIKILFILLIFDRSVIAQNKKQNLDKYFLALAQNREFNGNVLIAENGKIVYQKSFGYADFDSKRLNNNESVFPIMSITKTFTATAILQLQEKGKLKVTDFVNKYLPEFPYPSITIRHLLSHTSGLEPFPVLFDSLRKKQPKRIFTNKDLLPQYTASKLPLKYQPGEDGNYDNVNFMLLALIIEKVTGISYQNYVKNNIFKPSNLTKTFLPTINFYHYTPTEKRNLSLQFYYPHIYSDKIEKSDNSEIAKYWHNYNFSGFGEMCSTTEDLLKYDQALYRGKLLNKKSLDEAFLPVNLNNGKDSPVGYGLGWNIQKDSTFGKIVLHSGGGAGLSAVLLRNISKQQTVIIIDNNHGQDGFFVNEIGLNAIKILNGETVKPVGKSIAREYAKILVKNGNEKASETLEKLKKDPQYELIEDEFNSLGYDFKRENKMTEALETFKTNTQLFPNGWNTYDSYGEILLQIGKKEEAIEMYKKSMKLNPNNENGRKVLEQISKN